MNRTISYIAALLIVWAMVCTIVDWTLEAMAHQVPISVLHQAERSAIQGLP